MEIYQLKTFVVVAQEGSITRASERLFLSQPAVSAQIKALEDTLGITLFERTVRGMRLTAPGRQILAKAEQTLSTHRELVEEASRVKGSMAGRLRLGADSSANAELTGRVVKEFSERHPEVEVSLQHCSSLNPLEGIRSGDLDAGFYDDTGGVHADLVTMEASRYGIYLVAPRGMVSASQPQSLQSLAELPWIYPRSIPCYEQAAERLFKTLRIRPKRIISVDRESVTLMLLAKGTGVGLLHEDTASEAQTSGDVDVVCREQNSVRVLFGHLASRAQDPLLNAVSGILRESIGAAGTVARLLDVPAAALFPLGEASVPAEPQRWRRELDQVASPSPTFFWPQLGAHEERMKQSVQGCPDPTCQAPAIAG
ncbi:MAG: LysR family transcriptional regulator [Pseudomonadota bacterium]